MTVKCGVHFYVRRMRIEDPMGQTVNQNYLHRKTTLISVT